MAENNQKTDGGQPPKINVDATGSNVPTPKVPPPARPRSASKLKMDPNAEKKATVRIDPDTAMPMPKLENKDEKKETTRIDLSSAMPIPKGFAPRGEDDLRKSTTRIDWNGNGDIIPMSEEEKQEAAKKSTIRIDTSEITPIPEEDRNQAAKKSTVRVQIDEERAKGDTARLDAKAIAGAEEAAKKRTARIDLNEVLDESDDIFKRRTALLDAAKFTGTTEAPGAPRTIRIKRPETPPAPAPKLEEQIEPVDTEPDSAKKSETARIDLPPEATEQPPTRRKTIRIKRPEGGITTSKPLVIGRAEGAGEAGTGVSRRPVEEEAGALFSAMALVAVLVGIALVTVQSLTLHSFMQF